MSKTVGQSLERLPEIWPSLIMYMQKMSTQASVKKKRKIITIKKFDYSYYLNLLKDNHFHLQIIFLSSFINQLNDTNTALQNPKLEIHAKE